MVKLKQVGVGCWFNKQAGLILVFTPLICNGLTAEFWVLALNPEERVGCPPTPACRKANFRLQCAWDWHPLLLPCLGKQSLPRCGDSTGRNDGREDMGDGGAGSCPGVRLGSCWCYSVAALKFCSPGNAAAFSFLCSERKEN